MPARHHLLEPKLDQWFESAAKGDSLPLEELCRECPELIPQLASELESRGVPFYSLSKVDAPPAAPHARPAAAAVDAPTPLPRSWLPVNAATPGDTLGTLGGYHLLQVLGEGGMGTVFLAYDGLARRQLALKTMRPEIAMRPIARERFIREARSAAALDHEHIVPIYQVGEDRGIPFIAMPFLQGESLETRFLREPVLPLGWILKIAREVAAGLAVAHGQGLIHRDIKPANLFLSSAPRHHPAANGPRPAGESARPDDPRGSKVKILDFGLARPIESSENFTQPGTLVGTPGYMSPEQVDGLPIDARSDLFSLGCVLYQMATGAGPFDGPTLTAVLRATAEKDPRPVHHRNPLLPESLSRLIQRLLAKDRDRRPADAEEVLDAVRRIEAELSPPAGEPSPSSRRHAAVSAEFEPATLDLPPATEQLRVAGEHTRTALVVSMLTALIGTVVAMVLTLR